MDIFLLNREKMIVTMQNSLRQIRQICSWSAKDLGEYMGVTRQTINNIETKKTVMSTTQYVALCAVLDKKAESQPHLMRAVIAILEGNMPLFTDMQTLNSLSASVPYTLDPIAISLLDKWFMAFPQTIGPIQISKSVQIDENTLIAIAKHYKIIAHADFLLHPKAISFVTSYEKMLKRFSSKIIVPLRAVEAIQDAILSFNPSLYGPARNSLNLLAKMQKSDLLDIRGEESDQDLNGLMQAIFAKHRTRNRLFLLTQNEGLAKDVLQLNDSKTIQAYPISAGRLRDDGSLEELFPIEDPEEPEKSKDPSLPDNPFEGWNTIE